MTRGIIYLLTNPVFPSLVKIGMTTGDDVKVRMNQLYTTGVPLPFECVYAARVNDLEAVEAALHTAFSPQRVNPRREFFEIDPVQAIAIIKLLQLEDVTPQVERQTDNSIENIEKEAGQAYAKKRPRMNFAEMNIPIGSELVCKANGETAIVQTERTVLFRGQETSLTSATKTILENEYAVQPGPYWTYNGRSLRDIYNETYTVN